MLEMETKENESDLRARIKDAYYKIQYLVNLMDLEDDEAFTFPDGDTWYQVEQDHREQL